MSNYFTGKTVDEAIKNAVRAFNVDKDQLEITVVEEAAKGIFGLGGHPAKIMASKKQNEVEKTVEFLEGLFKVLDQTVSIEVSKNEEEKIVIDLITPNSSNVIGYRGEVLDSIQCLAGAIFNSDKEDYQRVVVDCEGYREKREKTLISLANKLANKAIKTGRKVSIEPMNPFERRIIHAALSDFEGVKTESEGKEPYRYVAIIPDGYDPAKERKFTRGGKGFNGKGDGKRPQRRDGERRKEEKPKKSFSAGVFLGNSLKDKE